MTAQRGARGGLQAKQFNFSELLYQPGTENTGWLDQNMIISAASSIPGLRVPEMLEAAKASTDTASALDAEAKAAGISSTPTILVGKTGGPYAPVVLASPTDAAGVEAAVDAALAG